MVYTVWIAVECLVERYCPVEPPPSTSSSTPPSSPPAHSPTVAHVGPSEQWTRRPFADLVVNFLSSRNDCCVNLFIAPPSTAESTLSASCEAVLSEVVRCFRWDALPLHILPQTCRTLAALGCSTRGALIVDRDVDGWAPSLRPQVMAPDPDPRHRRWSLLALLLKMCRVLDCASVPGMGRVVELGQPTEECAAVLIARAQAELLSGLPPLTVACDAVAFPSLARASGLSSLTADDRRAQLLSRLESVGATVVTNNPTRSLAEEGNIGPSSSAASAAAVVVSECWLNAVVACQSELLPVRAAETWLVPVLCPASQEIRCSEVGDVVVNSDSAAESAWIVLLLLLLLAPSSDVIGVCHGVTVAQVRDAAAQFIGDSWDEAALLASASDNDSKTTDAFSLMQQQCLEGMFVASALPERKEGGLNRGSGNSVRMNDDRLGWFRRRPSPRASRDGTQLSEDFLGRLVERLCAKIREIPAAPLFPPPPPPTPATTASIATSLPSEVEMATPLGFTATAAPPSTSALETSSVVFPTSRFGQVVEKVLSAKRSKWEKAVDSVLLSDMDRPFRDEYRLVGKPHPRFKTCHLPLFAYGIKVWFNSTEKIQKLIWKLFSFKSPNSGTEILSENILETTRVSFRKEKVTADAGGGVTRGGDSVATEQRIWCDFEFEFEEEADGFAQNLFVGWIGPTNKWQDRKDRILILPPGVTLEPLPMER